MTTLPEPPSLATESMALFLDVDGTLIPFADHPQAVRVPDGLPETLLALQSQLGGALALVSGRPIDELMRLFGAVDFDYAGLHGLHVQRRGQADTELAQGNEDIRAMLAPFEAFAAMHDGVLIEDKGPAIALHYRNAPEIEAEARKFVLELAGKSATPIGVLDGKCVLEVKPALANKGVAIDFLLAEAPYLDRRPVFLGDDVTDEYGFSAVNARDGVSVKIGPPYERTEARFSLESPAHVYDWLTLNAQSPSAC